MRTIHVKASRDYRVLVGRGLLDECGPLIKEAAGATRAAIVAGDIVGPLYAARVKASLEVAGIEASLFTLPHGEKNKTLYYYGQILEHLSAQRLGRGDVLIALGGGVTGDIAGFAAATYQRGMKLVQIPTTLLSAVDSSVGGKTAVDLPGGKNQVGCFYQPSLVICDPDTLSTLSPQDFSCGVAEVVKYSVLGGRDLYDALMARPIEEQLEDVICRCVEMKRDIVARDEFDLGDRQLLNLGHTLGHAVEACSGFSVLHGQAVAMGLGTIARAAVALGYAPKETGEQIQAILDRFALPSVIDYSAEELYQACLLDKKIRSGGLDLVVPIKIGLCRLLPIKTAELKDWMRAGGIAP